MLLRQPDLVLATFQICLGVMEAQVLLRHNYSGELVRLSFNFSLEV